VLTEFEKQQLVTGAAELGIGLDPGQTAQFSKLASLLIKKNEVLNLTRIKREDYVTLHFLDSLLAARLLGKPAATNGVVLDLGTGAGFPGLPLSIVYQSRPFVLIDGTKKKIIAVSEFASMLNLLNVTVRHARAEDMAKRGDRFDTIVIRAVAPLVKLAPVIAPLLSAQGRAIAYKGPEAEAEVKDALNLLKANKLVINKIYETVIPGSKIKRTLVEIHPRG